MNSIPELSMEDPNLVNCLIKHYDELEMHLDNNDVLKLQCKLDLLLQFFLENGKQMDHYVSLNSQLDNFIIIFRNLLRNNCNSLSATQTIPYSLKLLLLRLIESRSSKWILKDSVQEYYLNKLSFVDNSLSISPVNRNKPNKKRNTLRASKSAGDVSNLNLNHSNNNSQHFTNSFNHFNTSGRSLKAMKKIQFEGDILVKNNESGRVMGVKGRRVHMIEQLSNTVISFQKVPPTTVNRLVHISGPSPESIEIAKSIILTTIRDNVSPISEDLCASHDSLGPVPERTTESVWSIDSSSHVTAAPEYRLGILVNNEQITLSLDVPQIGKYLEEFLTKYDFEKYVQGRLKEQKVSSLIYDRETLLSLQHLARPLFDLDIDREFLRNPEAK